MFMKNSVKFIISFIIMAVSFGLQSLYAADLNITLKSEYATAAPNKTFRVTAYFNKPITKLLMTDIEIDGGRIESVRKINTKTYLIFARPSEDSREVSLQIPADVVKDKEGDLNEYASNDLSVKVTQDKNVLKEQEIANLKQSDQENKKMINDLVNTINNTNKNAATAAQSQTQTNANQNQVQYYNCNGKATPITKDCYTNGSYLPYTTIYTMPSYEPLYNDYYYTYYNYSNPYSNSNSYSSPYSSTYYSNPSTYYYSPSYSTYDYGYEPYYSAPAATVSGKIGGLKWWLDF